ncbi:MAG: hypothetical protein R2713_24010 [Ilumatobacteraceae bacterium]
MPRAVFSPPGTGTPPAVMLFADFSGRTGRHGGRCGRSPSVLYDTYVPPARSWFTTAARRTKFDVTIATTTPAADAEAGQTSTARRRLTFAEHQRLLQDAITTAGKGPVPANVASCTW